MAKGGTLRSDDMSASLDSIIFAALYTSEEETDVFKNGRSWTFSWAFPPLCLQPEHNHAMMLTHFIPSACKRGTN